MDEREVPKILSGFDDTETRYVAKKCRFLIAVMAASATACSAEPRSDETRTTALVGGNQPERTMHIAIILNGREIGATLEDSAASRQFMGLLPLDLTLADYNSTEKVADLPARLDVRDAPEGIDPEIGDIAYYAPWGNLAIFYKDFGHSRGLVRLGRIDGGVGAFAKNDRVRVRIERR